MNSHVARFIVLHSEVDEVCCKMQGSHMATYQSTLHFFSTTFFHLLLLSYLHSPASLQNLFLHLSLMHSFLFCDIIQFRSMKNGKWGEGGRDESVRDRRVDEEHAHTPLLCVCYMFIYFSPYWGNRRFQHRSRPPSNHSNHLLCHCSFLRHH